MPTATSAKRIGADLVNGPLLKSLILFAIPIVLSSIIQQLYTMVDLIVIEKYMGAVGTSGVSVGGELSDFISPIAVVLASAVQVYIGQLVGAGQMEKTRRAAGTAISMFLLFAVAVMLVGILLCRPILSLLNCPQEAFSQAAAYMVISAFGLPFVFGYHVISGILRGMGESKRPLFFILIAAAVNVLLDILLVAVFHLEAAGTAIATVMSEIACCIAAFLCMYRNRKAIGFSFSPRFFAIDRECAVVLLQQGVPRALHSILVRFSMVWVNAQVNAYGLVFSSTNGIGNKLLKFLEVYSSGFHQASSAVVAQNLGAQKPERASKSAYYSLGICASLAAVVSLVVLLSPESIFGIFASEAPVLETGCFYLRIMIIHLFLTAWVNAFQSVIAGCGDARMNFAIGLIDGIVCRVGLCLLFAKVMNMGAYGYFWGTALTRLLPAFLVTVYFVRGSWKTRSLVRK